MSVHLIQSWPYLSLVFFFCQNLSLIFIHLLALISFPREKLTDVFKSTKRSRCMCGGGGPQCFSYPGWRQLKAAGHFQLSAERKSVSCISTFDLRENLQPHQDR